VRAREGTAGRAAPEPAAASVPEASEQSRFAGLSRWGTMKGRGAGIRRLRIRRSTGPACITSGYGNFHMKPNGVFYISGDRAAVVETRAFLKHRPQADLATQSGPMLVINGRLHPRFDRSSRSLKARTGVGVRADGEVVFAISRAEVSFDAFARLFRDALNCPNALFLDGGSAASLYAPSLNRYGHVLSLGPMLAVFERSAIPQ
jgi:uncharacterized protein YigE (DUF2233 family)